MSPLFRLSPPFRHATTLVLAASVLACDGEGPPVAPMIVTPPSSRFSFALADQPSAPAYTPALGEQVAPAGAPITVGHPSPGTYAVFFPKVTKTVGQREVVIVSPTGVSDVDCQVAGWDFVVNGVEGLLARVNCFKTPTGLAADAPFSIALVDDATLAGRSGFALVDARPTMTFLTTYFPDPTHAANSSGGAIRIFRIGVGFYELRWAGLGGPIGELPLPALVVRAYGNLPHRCSVLGMVTNPGDLQTVVGCTDLAGAQIDAPFVVMLADQGRARRRYSVAFANQRATTSYENSGASHTSTGGAVLFGRDHEGSYQVRLEGVARTGPSPETVVVTATELRTFCKATAWSTIGSDMLVSVRCFDSAGRAVDSTFDLFLVE